jgi:Spy/CpxP family protein refolding chaperone
MKNSISSILLLFTFLVFAGAVSAQDNPPPPQEGDRMPPPGMQQGPPRQEDDRGEILRQLNLTQDQFKAIRKLLGDNGPLVRDAQRDFREAQEALDEAIYADTVDDALVQSLTKRSADAQATLMKLRTINEFAIRRILSPEQVTRFRELRKQQMQMRQERQKMQKMNGDGPKRMRPMGQPGQPGQPGMQPPGQPINNALPNQPRRRPA